MMRLPEAPMDGIYELDRLLQGVNPPTGMNDKGEALVGTAAAAQAMAESDDARYWRKRKTQLQRAGFPTTAFCCKAKLEASDGKLRLMDASTEEQLLRLAAHIPGSRTRRISAFTAESALLVRRIGQNPDLAYELGDRMWTTKGRRRRTAISQKDMNKEWEANGARTEEDQKRLEDANNRALFGMTEPEIMRRTGMDGNTHNIRDNLSGIGQIAAMFHDALVTQLIEKNRPQGAQEIESKAINPAGAVSLTMVQGAAELLEKSVEETMVQDKEEWTRRSEPKPELPEPEQRRMKL